MDVISSGRQHWKVSIIVPTLNEETTIEQVLTSVRPYADELLVVDGGSTDETLRVVKSLGVTIVNDGGGGKGIAVRHALQIATHPIVLFVDGDGSHEPSDIPRLLEPIRNNQADIVIGSRMTGGSDELFSDAAEFVRLTGSMLINLAINYRWNVRLSDTQNGFRSVLRDVGLALNLTENSTTIEQEMVMKALATGYRIVNVPSHEYRRQGGESKISIKRVWFKYIINVLKHIL